MGVEIRVPTLGESVTEATVGKWFKKPGDAVKADEPLVELETDKVTIEVPAPSDGVMGDILVAQGGTVAVGSVIGALQDAGNGAAAPSTAAPSKAPAAPQPTAAKTEAPRASGPDEAAAGSAMPPSPAARKVLAEAGLDANEVHGSGKRGQVLKSDVEAAVQSARAAPAAPASKSPASHSPAGNSPAAPVSTPKTLK